MNATEDRTIEEEQFYHDTHIVIERTTADKWLGEGEEDNLLIIIDGEQITTSAILEVGGWAEAFDEREEACIRYAEAYINGAEDARAGMV